MDRKYTILIVDDNLENIEDLTGLLENRNYHIRIAHNGEQAVNSVKAIKPDLILMDVLMPNGDGYKVTREIKSLDGMGFLPIILLSVLSESPDIVKGFDSGCVDYISRPFNEEEFCKRIETHLKVYECQNQLKSSNDELYRKFKSTFDQIAVGVCHVDITSKQFIMVNGAFTNLLGYSNEELLDMTISDLVHPDYYDNEIKNINGLVENKMSSFTSEFPLLKKDGTHLCIKNAVSLVYSSNGEPDYLIGVFEDITKRKESELKIKKSEELFKGLMESSMDSIIFVNKKHEILQVNKQCELLFGYSKDELLNQKIELIIPKQFKQSHIHKRNEYVKKPQKRTMGIGLELSAVKKDGTEFPVEVAINPLYTDDGLIISTTLRDITDRKNKEEIIVRSEERLKVAVGNSKIGIWDWDIVAGKQIWDSTMYQLYDIKVDDIITQSKWSKYLHPKDRENTEKQMQLALDNQKKYETEFRIITDKGDVRHIHSSATTYFDEDHNPIRMIGVNIDMTDTRVAEIQLKASEARLKEALHIAKLGSWRLDIRTNQLEWSDEIYNIVNRNKGSFDLNFDAFVALVHPDDREALMMAYSNHVENKLPYDIDHRLLLDDGTIKHVHEHCYSKYNEDGSALFSLGTVQDITEKKLAEQKIVALNEELEDRVIRRTKELEYEKYFNDKVINTLPGIFYTIDGNSTFSRWNRNLQELLGLSDEDMLTQKVMDTIAEHDRSNLGMTMEKAFLEGQASTEGHLISKDGSHKPFFLTGAKLVTNDDQFIVGVGFDISERKLAEEEVLRLSRAVEQSSASVVITNRDGIITYVNKAFETVTGYSYAEAIGQNPSILKSGEMEQSFYKNLWISILNGETWKGEFLNKKKNGDQFWEFASISPIMNDIGEIISFVAVKEDVTKRKQMDIDLRIAIEKAESATRAKSDFLANMSHEIRTPMNAIIGLSYLALRTNLNEKQADYVDKINRSGKNLLGIINDILDFSKIEAGKLELETIEFNLEDTIHNLMNVVMLKADEKNLEIIVNIDKEVPNYLIGDPLRLSQILVNLINNAIKFTENGEIIIKIKNIEIENEVCLLKISVLDTGIGMTIEQQKKLFNSFEQADTSTTRKYGGTGLGLTISKNLAELMGGNIDVKSDIDKGSEFYFTASFGLQKFQSLRNISLPYMNELKAIIIEDNHSTLAVTKRYLEDFGIQVEGFYTGEEAFLAVEESISQNKKMCDLFIVDYKLPGINGVELIEKLRRRDEINRQSKIVMSTNFARQDIIDAANLVNVDKILQKPVTHSILFDMIMQLFSNEDIIELKKQPNEKRPDGFELVRGANILLVEDNEFNQQVGYDLLVSERFNVTIATDGKEAVDYIHNQNNKYDIVLMDLQMPVMDGYTATKIIRETLSKEDLPVVAMTADAMSGVRDQIMEIGMNDYVPKPINPDLLWEVLSKWIEHKKRDVILDEEILSVVSVDCIEKLKYSRLINVEKGLRHVNHKEDVYFSVLTKFYNNYTEIKDEIETAFVAKDYKLAQRKVHNMKSISGTIGATDLYKISDVLENAIIERNVEAISIELNVFDEMITAITNEIAPIILTAKGNLKKDVGTDLELSDLIDDLSPYVVKRKITLCKKIVNDLKEKEWSIKYTEHVNELIQAISKYRFEVALSTISKMKELLDLRRDD